MILISNEINTITIINEVVDVMGDLTKKKIQEKQNHVNTFIYPCGNAVHSYILCNISSSYILISLCLFVELYTLRSS